MNLEIYGRGNPNSAKANELLEKYGQPLYRKPDIIDVEVLQEDKIVQESGGNYYNDGVGPVKNVTYKKGTIFVDDSYEISKEDLESKYKPYEDEKGNIVPHKYIDTKDKTTNLVAIPNLFGEPITEVNGGIKLREYGPDCIIYKKVGDDTLMVINKERFMEIYEPLKEQKLEKVKPVSTEKTEQTKQAEQAKKEQNDDTRRKAALELTEAQISQQLGFADRFGDKEEIKYWEGILAEKQKIIAAERKNFNVWDHIM
ncbi:MAG: hypothetical protein LBQ05_02360 [Christensenellaceae bacterium]|jgi:hypothetical protein|nr:hypothetical protein [Christensenellaceae bacterium]